MLDEPANNHRNDALKLKKEPLIENKSHVESFPEGPWSVQNLFLMIQEEGNLEQPYVFFQHDELTITV